MIMYRGITVDDNVKLYNKNGSYNKKIKNSLDELVDKLSENGHELLSEYIGSMDKVLIDFKCGHEPQSISPNEYKIGRGCTKCGNIKAAETLIEKTKEEFVFLVASNGHLLLNDYLGAKDYVLIDYLCGHGVKSITPDYYRQGRGCPECRKIQRIKKEKEKFTLLIASNGHELIDGEFIDSQTKVCVDFKCGHNPHWVTPNSYKQGSRCPVCNESKGEKRIRKWLKDNNFTYNSQVEYDGLIGIGRRNLSYDFYLPKQNILIEYQGEQHERFIEGVHETVAKFKKQQEHDRRKREYALQQNITLLEIWYWNFDRIEEILHGELNIINNVKQIVI